MATVSPDDDASESMPGEDRRAGRQPATPFGALARVARRAAEGAPAAKRETAVGVLADVARRAARGG